MEKIIIFWGAVRDFDTLLQNEIPQDESLTRFMEIIQDYNARIRPNAALSDNDRKARFDVENLIVKASDYASVLEHVIYNFVNVTLLNHDIKRIFLHNPPDTIVRALEVLKDDIDIEERYSDYLQINKSCLRDIHNNLEQNIIGQSEAKQSILSALYKSCNKVENKPVVLLLYGASGIGKTETAKEISRTLGGKLMRMQFSMMQTSEAANYVFGSEHSKNCFARDLLERETNIVLIDEFDKVSPQFYNAFYQLFDEGTFSDTHYNVDAKNCVFLCTTNFETEKAAEEYMGAPIYSRFTDIISFKPLTTEEKQEIVKMMYDKCLSTLTDEELEILAVHPILDFYLNNTVRFSNVRIIKRNIEKSIYTILTSKFLSSDESKITDS